MVTKLILRAFAFSLTIALVNTYIVQDQFNPGDLTANYDDNSVTLTMNCTSRMADRIRLHEYACATGREKCRNYCPDCWSYCKETETCCLKNNGLWGCCPFRYARCCDDHVHCCPSGYRCDLVKGGCTDGRSITQWQEKSNASPHKKLKSLRQHNDVS